MSCLGPLLFVIYASKLFTVVGDQLLPAHCYGSKRSYYTNLQFDDIFALNEYYGQVLFKVFLHKSFVSALKIQQRCSQFNVLDFGYFFRVGVVVSRCSRHDFEKEVAIFHIKVQSIVNVQSG